MSWFGRNSDRKFVPFDEKTIDEQADDITRALILREENPLFDFDYRDEAKRNEFTKSCFGAAIVIMVSNTVSLRTINKMKGGKALGPLRKFLILNTLNLPFYWYFYNDMSNTYMELKRHLVTRYLIVGDEILYKRKVNRQPSTPNQL